MRIILSSSTARDLIVDAIQQVVDSNNEQIQTITIFDPHDTPQCQQENKQGIQEIEQENRKLVAFIEKLKTVDGFNVTVLRSKMYELWFKQLMPKHINVSYETKLQSLGTIDCLIKLGFDKLTGCNSK